MELYTDTQGVSGLSYGKIEAFAARPDFEEAFYSEDASFRVFAC